MPNYRSGKASIMEYMGVRRFPKNTPIATAGHTYNIVPILAYYDVFKNYYANKQEERFYVMGGSIVQNGTTIVTGVFKGIIDIDYNGLRCTSAPTITFTGTDVNLNNIEKIKFNNSIIRFPIV